MESVGQKLRAARLHLGVRLEDVSACTRINLKYLTALEADAFDVIGSRFIYKSFALQAAQAVGLDPESLRGDVETALTCLPEPLVPGQPGAPAPPQLASLRTPRVRWSRWISSLTLLIVMLAACSGLYALWQNSRGRVLASLESFHFRSRGAISAVTAKVPASAVSVPVPLPSEAPVAAAPEPPAAPVRVEVAALERTWLSVAADGKEVYTGILLASQSKSLEGQERARIRTGNAGGVEVTFNGKKLGPLGSKGQVRTIVFKKDGYRIIQSPQHLAFADFTAALGQSFGQ
jgi:cytoskeleton protein RodZ